MMTDDSRPACHGTIDALHLICVIKQVLRFCVDIVVSVTFARYAHGVEICRGERRRPPNMVD